MTAVPMVQIGKLSCTMHSLFSPKFNVIRSSIRHVSAGYHTTVFIVNQMSSISQKQNEGKWVSVSNVQTQLHCILFNTFTWFYRYLSQMDFQEGKSPCSFTNVWLYISCLRRSSAQSFRSNGIRGIRNGWQPFIPSTKSSYILGNILGIEGILVNSIDKTLASIELLF